MRKPRKNPSGLFARYSTRYGGRYCTTTRRGGFLLGRKPVAKRVNKTLARIEGVLRKRWHHDIWDFGAWLGRVLENRDQAEASSVSDHTELFDRIIDLVMATYGPQVKDLSDEASERLVAAIREPFDEMDVEKPWEGAAPATDQVT